MESNTPEAAPLTFRLFGTFAACRHKQPVTGLHLRKGERLLAYLILRAGQWVETKKLAAEFWSDIPTDDPAANLRQSLTYLRQQLKAEAECLESRVGAVRLHLREEQADTLQFVVACERDDPASLAFACHISEEPLLAEWDDAWIVAFRERFERKRQSVCARLMAAQQSMSDSPPEAAPTYILTGADGKQNAQAGLGTTGPTVGGALSPVSPFYMVRTADTALYTALAQQESIVLIKGARQVGKSSLLARGLHFARQRGTTVCHADCEQFAPEDIASRDLFYLGLAGVLAEQCDQEFDPATDWKAHLGANGNLERFLRRRVLACTEAPVLWALDGVDRLFKTDYYNEFFALLRGLHTKRATEPDVPWSRLTVLLAAATEAHLYICDLNQSPFNVGTRIALEDFDPVQSAELLRRYEWTPSDETEQTLLHDLLGGHPYLLARGLHEMKMQNLAVAAFADLALRPTSPFRDHLEGILHYVNGDDALRADLQAVLEGGLCSEKGFFRLRTAGVLSGDAPDAARLRCGLYARYFARCVR